MYASDQPTSYYQNIAANIAKINTYIAGGGVLIAHCCDIGIGQDGDWTGLKILPGASWGVTTGQTHEYSDDVRIVDPRSPIANDLSDALLSGWGYSSHGYFNTPTLPEGTNVVMDINGDSTKPTYIVYPYGFGRVLATMQTVEWQYDGSYKGAALQNLLDNEINDALPNAKGVDVSDNNWPITDWSAVYGAGYRFAYIKATQGTSFITGDPKKKETSPYDLYTYYINPAIAANLKVGVYHYADPENETGANSAVDEATWFVNNARNYIKPGYLPPALDLELNTR